MYFEDIELNQVIEVPPVVIEKEKMIEFAKLYDNIPLHTDEEYAKSTRFGGLIAPGVMSFMSVWSKYIEVDIIKRELIAGKSTKIEWLKPVYAGDVLKGRSVISKKAVRNEKSGTIEITIEAYNQNGICVLTNVTEAVVKRRP